MNPPPLCPDPDLLEQYRKGELAPTQAAEMRVHLATCGLCSLLVERLDSFDAIAQAPALSPSADWERLQPRIDHQFQQKLAAAQPTSRPPRANLLSWLSQPALGWCAALVLAYTTWRGYTQPEPSAPPLATQAHFLDLNATRGPGAAPAAITASRNRTPLVLSFFVAVQPGRTYSVTLTSESGATILRDLPIQPNDDKGNFFVHCDSALLPAGNYQLTLDSANTPATSRQFQFTVR